MKLKINKASDLSSISVLPPQSRRPSGAENSIFGRTQASASQLRSQTSQQSFSQGVSSQHGLFSQISQNSLDDHITNEQRLNSQERETSVKRGSCLPPINYSRDESQVLMSRSSANLMRKWSTPEYKCQISEELEHKIGIVETSLSRIGIILESIQSDIIQINKGTKELLLEMQGVRQKMVVHDDFLQLMNKGQEDIKSSFDRALKAWSGKILDKSSPESLRAISSTLSALPQKIETSILNLQRGLVKTFTKEMQALSCSLQVSKKECATPIIHHPKAIDHLPTSKGMHSLKSMQIHSKVHQATKVAKIEMEGWKSVKLDEAALKDINLMKNSHLKGVSSVQQERKCKLLVESDEDSEGGLFCLLKGTGNNNRDLLQERSFIAEISIFVFPEKDFFEGNSSIEEARNETEHILRKARRKKRKRSSTIYID